MNHAQRNMMLHEYKDRRIATLKALAHQLRDSLKERTGCYSHRDVPCQFPMVTLCQCRKCMEARTTEAYAAFDSALLQPESARVQAADASDFGGPSTPFDNTQCPICHGTDLASSGAPSLARQGDHAGAILQPMECENCGSTWTALYRIAGCTELVNNAG